MRGRSQAPREFDRPRQRRLYPRPMWKFLTLAVIALAMAGCATSRVEATKLKKASVLPLELNDNFQFRKVLLSFYSEAPAPETESEPILFERQRMAFGALDSTDIQQRFGNYFTFFWRTSETADVTIRLEYRQTALGNYVMAMERYYPEARGSHRSEFQVTGDDFLEFGRVTAWRALLVVDGRIVALRQSFMWR